ncbi:hypothetical protein [Pseudomonas sp. PS02290]|uniref:hypothetical protein n=1 Tax=Pseudomonas sp. PS02290 TaxID=2991430 RepID=UPI00249B06A6|nr:hypothetical protein [Pseudomonas sp. PS02290]
MSQTPEFNLNTPDGGRGYIDSLFKTVLKRHDFRQYINDRLAGDFACTLAQYLESLNAQLAEQVHKNTTEVSRYNDELQVRLHLADELIRDAWRLMDGQDAKTSSWHLLASLYINNPDAAGVDIKAIGLIDTARVDLYERLHMQEFALVPYFDDSVAKWFIPPADDDQHDGQAFGTWRQAIDSLAQVGDLPLAPVVSEVETSLGDLQARHYRLLADMETIAARQVPVTLPIAEFAAAAMADALSNTFSGFKWEDFQRIANKPGVHCALAAFSADSTGDNGVRVVQAVIEALNIHQSSTSPCNDCHVADFCMSIRQEEIRCSCNSPNQVSKAAMGDERHE